MSYAEAQEQNMLASLRFENPWFSTLEDSLLSSTENSRFPTLSPVRFYLGTKKQHSLFFLLCIYTTTLEPILARISEMNERSAPPPCRQAALPRRKIAFSF
ncbi:MAG TPA: hypothetical protein DEP25_03400 [Candidatus Taylorbacteria bacterium]|nr:hypothetical protein [Candidatus Taylorbacteria bacterium]